MEAGYINTILCSTVLAPNNKFGIGSLTHCFNRINCGLTHCLINLFPSVLGGVYIFFVVSCSSYALILKLVTCFSHPCSFLLYFVLVMLLTLKLVPCFGHACFFCSQGEDLLRAWPSMVEVKFSHGWRTT